MKSFLAILVCTSAAMSWKMFPTPNFGALSKKIAVISAAVAVQVNFGQSVLPALADDIPVVGAPAPSFNLPSNTGKPIGLSDLLGKRTVLYFYPGDFTSGCTIEAQSFELDIDTYKNLNAQVVGVSVDTVDKHLDFGKRYGLDFPLLSDQGGKVSDQYGSMLNLGFLKVSNRQTYIISPTGKVEYVFTNVDSHLAEHSKDVLKVLEQLNERDNAAV